MKDSRERTIPQQFGSLLLRHIGADVVSFVFGIVAFAWLLEDGVWKVIFSVIFSIVYLGIVAAGAKKIAVYDMKEYSPMTASYKKALLLGLGLCAITAVIFLLYKMSWLLMSENEQIITMTGKFYNMLFWCWCFPWYGFLGSDIANVPVYVVAIVMLIQLVSVFIGYVAGMKNFDIADKILPMMYEKRNKTE